MLRLVLLSVSLALDAFAVSVSLGIAHPEGGASLALKLGLWFGGAQLLMPMAGHVLGRALTVLAAGLAPWAAFGLLSFIGGKMIWAGLQPPSRVTPAEVGAAQLLPLAFATSTDALAAGVGLSCMAFPLLVSCVFVGGVAFVLSTLGALMGRSLGKVFHACAQVAGGSVLILIGAKFLLEAL